MSDFKPRTNYDDYTKFIPGHKWDEFYAEFWRTEALFIKVFAHDPFLCFPGLFTKNLIHHRDLSHFFTLHLHKNLESKHRSRSFLLRFLQSLYPVYKKTLCWIVQCSKGERNLWHNVVWYWDSPIIGLAAIFLIIGIRLLIKHVTTMTALTDLLAHILHYLLCTAQTLAH